MAFTIEDFQDLVRVLEQQPEWRAELRRLLLPNDVLDLPQLLRQLAEAQLRTEERLGRLEQTVADLAQQVGQLVQAQLRTEQAVILLAVDSGLLKGGFKEILYARHASGYFGSILRRIHVLSDEELWNLLEEEMQQGRLTYPEARDAALADIVMRGRSLQDGNETYLVVEVSWTIDNEDVERAIRRAGRLARSGRRVTPVVAGTVLSPQVGNDARTAGVWHVTDGVAVGPDA